MEVQSYNRELVLANAQFKRLFNNIQIKSGDKSTKFTCVLENRSRIFKGLENPDRNSMYKLPLISIQRTGLTKNNERLANVNNEIKYRKHSKMNVDYNIFTPVPVDISYQVTIISKYQEHIDKAISNLMPFFNKDLFVRCEHPKFEGLSYTNQIIMDDTITEEAPVELDSSQDDIRTCIMNFTMKTFLFCGNKRAIYVPSTEKQSGFTPTINQIYFGFYPIPTLSQYIPHMTWVDNLDQTVYNISGIGSYDISGNPISSTIDTYRKYDPYVDIREDIFVIGID